MGKKLKNIITKSDLMNIKIKYKGDVIKFNLYDELVISESKINAEIKDQPSYMGFLGLLLAHLRKTEADKKAELKKEYGRLYNMYKKQVDETTSRIISNDKAENKVYLHKNYKIKLEEYNKSIFEREIIEACSNSFSARKDLIQSLSANVRKTN